MTEIRDRVKGEALEFIRHGASPEQILEKILSIPELAIVDRGAELPKNPKSIYIGGMSERDIGELDGFNKAIDQVAKAGWVKEVK